MMLTKLKFYFGGCLAASLVLYASADSEGVADGTNTVSAAVKEPAATNGPASPAASGFETFRLITERNIFNQSRGPRSARRESGPSRPAPKIQSLALVGTMSYAKGNFAFFDGTSPEYKKPVKAGEKIAEYEVKTITASSVKVANDKEEFELKVGQQLRKEDEGAWELAAGGSNGGVTRADNDSVKSESGGASEDEALRRLMEKRAKEMNQ